MFFVQIHYLPDEMCGLASKRSDSLCTAQQIETSHGRFVCQSELARHPVIRQLQGYLYEGIWTDL